MRAKSSKRSVRDVLCEERKRCLRSSLYVAGEASNAFVVVVNVVIQ